VPSESDARPAGALRPTTRRFRREGGPKASESLRPADSPGLLLWRATLRWQRLITVALKPLDLTHVQFVLLASTWWLTHVAGETPSQRRLAEHAGTDPMMTSQVLRALQAKGLIARTAHPDDSRARSISVTRRGATVAKQAVSVVEAADTDFFRPAGNQKALLDLLRHLAS
jgi:DNA-binding MarR family transcriptional regulator